MRQYFTHTISRIGGAGLDRMTREILLRHSQGFERWEQAARQGLSSGGKYQWRRQGEAHQYQPRMLALFRQGIACDFQAREEGRTLRISFSDTSLIWHLEAGQTPPSIVKHLLARSPVSASDLVRVRELQEESDRNLQEISLPCD